METLPLSQTPLLSKLLLRNSLGAAGSRLSFRLQWFMSKGYIYQ